MRLAQAAARGWQRLWTRREFRGVALALTLKVGGSVLAFAMLTLSARAMGLGEFGLFVIWFSALSFLSATILMGQEALIMVDWQQSLTGRGPQAARAILRRSTLAVGVTALLGGGATVVVGRLTDHDYAFSLWAAAFTILLAGLVYGTHVARLIVGIAHGDAYFELTWRIFPMGGALAALLLGTPFDAEAFFFLASIGIALSLALQTVGIHRAIDALPASPPLDLASIGDVRDWVSRSASLWIGGVLDAANQYAEVFLIGLLVSPIDAGLYYAAARLAAVFAIITAGLHVFSTREIARHAGDASHDALRRSLRLVASVTAVIIAGSICAVLFEGPLLLTVFGEAFQAAYGPLLVLSIGVAFTALGGPAPAVLRLTGHQTLYAQVTAVFVVIRCISIVVAAVNAGLMGAAVASAACSVAYTFALNRACRSRVTIDPSVLVLLNVRKDAS